MSRIGAYVLEQQEGEEPRKCSPQKSEMGPVESIPPLAPEEKKKLDEYIEKHNLPF